MSKPTDIRWRKKDRKAISTLARVFNSKITRTLNKNPEFKDYLPDRIVVADLVDQIKTRQDFNRIMKSFGRFMKKGAEMVVANNNGVKTTKWELREIGYKVAQVNRDRTKERKEKHLIASTYKGTMGTLKENELRPKKFNFETMTKRGFEKYKATLEKQVASNFEELRAKSYVENYCKAIDSELGEWGTEIKERVRKIPPQRFYEIYYEDPQLQIDFVYDPHEAQMITEQILLHLDKWGY